jgi:hypothetical protein
MQNIKKEIRRHIPSRKFCLKQYHFERGTFRIRKPGRYVLSEDILFHPYPHNQFRPPADSKYAQLPAYSLGFFAALTIECDGVEIDLAGHSICQSEACALFQRYYSHIELASTPFLPGQGPGNFGPALISPRWIWIHGGVLGRSSHHGIHGNGNRCVYIQQVEIKDFEFVGAALNGAHDVVYDECHIHHNWCNIPVAATWSAALYLEQFVERILADGASPDGTVDVFSNLKKTYTRFKCLLEMTKAEILAGRTVSHPLFSNPTGFPDGNVFGIVSNPLGVAIHDFARPPSTTQSSPVLTGCKKVGAYKNDIKHRQKCETFEKTSVRSANDCKEAKKKKNSEGKAEKNSEGKAEKNSEGKAEKRAFDSAKNPKNATNIIIWRCQIHNLSANVDEVIGIGKCDGSGIHKGVTGELFRVGQCSNEGGHYMHNAWTDVLLQLGLLKSLGTTMPLGTLYLSPDILEWFQGRILLSDVLRRGYTYISGLDAMGHHNKGVIGVRWDGTQGGVIFYTRIHHLLNIGTRGSSVAGTYLEPGGLQSSPYRGTMTCGLHLAFSQDVQVAHMDIHDLCSENGLCAGIRSIHESSGGLEFIRVENLRSGKSFKDGCWLGSISSPFDNSRERRTCVFETRLPNAIPESVGLWMAACSQLYYKDLRVEFLYGPQTRFLIISEK